MERDIAWQVIRTAFRCSSDLQALMKLLKEHCAPEEYKSFAIGIAMAIDSLNVQLVDRALAARPELAARIESDLGKFGHLT